MENKKSLTASRLIVAFSSLLILLGGFASSVQAMTTLTIDAIVVGDSIYASFDDYQGEVGEITLTFDETTLVDGIGDFGFDDDTSIFDINMTIFGQTFGRDSDLDTAPEWDTPWLEVNGDTYAITWVISEIDLPESSSILDGGSYGDNYVDIEHPSILSMVIYHEGTLQFNDVNSGSANLYNVGVDIVVVPVPAAAWLFATALASLAGVSSRRRSAQ
ncbi:MAG: hypothetical protein CL692_00475 [Cellvibrionales bacterium]|nr:hypothetical protein [Cellvibrionales bacterium]